MSTAPDAASDAATEPERAPRRAAAVARGTRRALGVFGTWIVAKIPELVLQCVLIIISIVLGLAVNKRIEERSDHDRKVALLTSFEQEIADNLAQLQSDVDDRKDLHATLVALSSTGELRTAEVFYDSVGLKGFRPVALRTTAWQTAVTTGALRLLDDDSIASVLSRTYTQQAEYERAGESRMPEFLRTGMAPQGPVPAMVRAAERYLEDESDAGDELAAVYRYALTRIAAARQRLGG
ncbi:MAG TPA: hypothetical protein VF541_09610 [Longimicrobium sp.]|jgi:hypothetical protein